MVEPTHKGQKGCAYLEVIEVKELTDGEVRLIRIIRAMCLDPVEIMQALVRVEVEDAYTLKPPKQREVQDDWFTPSGKTLPMPFLVPDNKKKG